MRELPSARGSRSDGAVLPAAGDGLRAMLAGPARRPTSRRTRSSASTPTSRRTRTAGSSTRARYAERMTTRARPRAGRPRRRARQQRRLPAAALRRAPGIPVLGIEPAQNVAAAAEAPGVPTLVAVLRPATSRSELVASRPPGRPDRRQQRAGPGPGPQRLRGRHRRACSRPTACVTIEFPHLAPPPRGRPVRHDLPRALLVLLAGDPRPDHRRPRPGGRRRRRAADARRLAPRVHVRHAGRPRPSAPAVGALLAREREAGLEDVATYAAFGDARRRAQAGGPARAPDRLRARPARRWPATARPGKANTLLNYCGDPARPAATTRSTATRTSTAGSRPARASRSTRPSGSTRDAARRRSGSCPGTSRDEIAAQLADVARLGRRLFVAIPIRSSRSATPGSSLDGGGA